MQKNNFSYAFCTGIVTLLVSGVTTFIACASDATTQNLRKYYALRDAAVDCIVAENFDSAAFYYRQAFKHKEHPFNEDILNATFCELKSSVPDTAACVHYFKEYGMLSSKDKYKDCACAGIDTLLIAQLGSNLPNFLTEDTSAYPKIRRMVERDRKVRTTYPPGSFFFNKVDSINIMEMKELMKTVDVFDENTGASGGNFSMLFNHWFDYEGVSDFFEPHLRKAVLDGRMSARNYVCYMDEPSHNKPGRDTSSSAWLYGYGSLLLNICGNYRKDKMVAYFNFDSNNAEHVELLHEIDRQREAIYLAPIIESSIRELKFWLYVSRHDYWGLLRAQPTNILFSEKAGRKTIENMIEKGIPVIYYIEDEHDFNIK